MLASPAAVHAAEPAKPAAKPNIIIILADDLGYSDIGCYGSEIETPNLDQLAKEGIRFSDFHNCVKCSPSRASLLTGLYPQQVKMADLPSQHGPSKQEADGPGDLPNSCVTIAEVLKSSGYSTFMSGKWHLTTQIKATTLPQKFCWPLQRGFDHYFGFLYGSVDSYFNTRNLVEDNAPISPQKLPSDFYITDLITEKACGFMEGHFEKGAANPFFMYVAYNAPHYPVEAKPGDVEHYKGVYDVGWDALRKARFEKQKAIGLGTSSWELSERNPAAKAWSSLDAQAKKKEAQMMQTYAGMITTMDRGVGQIVETLKKHHQLENTCLIFLSDNGANSLIKKQPTIGPSWANLGNAPFRYWKSTTWQGGASTPLIVHWPAGIQSSLNGKFVRDVGHIVDLMPTCVELSGAAYPTEYHKNKITPMEGMSLVPTFSGGSVAERTICWRYAKYDAVQQGSWRMVRQKGQDWMLFNLKDDPAEMRDVASKTPEVVKSLAGQWNEWASRVEAEEGQRRGKNSDKGSGADNKKDKKIK